MLIGIIGAGAAGTLLILELIRLGVSPQQIVIVDPHFDGGSLQRSWGSIHSNTRWEQVRDILQQYESASKPLEVLNARYTSEQTVLLSDIGLLLQECLKVYSSDLQTYVDVCREIIHTDSNIILQLTTQKVIVDLVFLCQGGVSNRVDCGKPSIPLEVALDPSRLRRYVKPGEIVSVFGLAHSGTLVLKHLIEIGAEPVGFYKSSTPFLFARDGHYDGIKQESAEIADRILSNQYEKLKLYPVDDLKHLIKSVARSSWIISCTGFSASPIQIIDTTNQRIDSFQYNPQTAQIFQRIYGFGLAYPGITELNGKSHKDISIPSFVNQIQRCLPEILKNNQS